METKPDPSAQVNVGHVLNYIAEEFTKLAEKQVSLRKKERYLQNLETHLKNLEIQLYQEIQTPTFRGRGRGRGRGRPQDTLPSEQ